MLRKIILAILLLVMAATVVAADTIYLRNGQTLQGTVLGYVNGRFAVKLTVAFTPQANTQSGNNATVRTTSEVGEIVFIRPRDIERVEIDGRPLDDARYVTRNVSVELGPNWVDTGIDLRRGERVQVNSTGTIFAGRSRITPGGLRTTDPNAPLPRAAEGVLIGVIGTDSTAPIIEIGLNREFVADRDGRLYLTLNRGSYADASGAFTAQIRREINLGQRAGGRRNEATDENDDPNDLFGSGSPRNGSAGVRRRNTGGDQFPANTPSEPRSMTRSISIPGDSRGTDTGIDLRTGDGVTVSATGVITAGRRAGDVGPDGGRASIGGALLGTRPVPSAGVGALVGYIRLQNGQVSQSFLIGSQQTFTAPADGRLFLQINDDNYSDNSGSFNATINVTSGGTTSGNFPRNEAGNSQQTVNVGATSQAVDTGIELRRGDTVSLSARGLIYSRGTGGISPDGDRRYDSISGNTPVPDSPFGALVGYIRTSDGRSTAPFLIGSERTLRAPADGRLFLMINDNDYRDNSGGFSVRIVY
ncbi:MAG: hypothetical protein QOJ64_4299 [Acidobacteriota bacterium]|nr:hypothetical protein [Acidobacteriota bacterium]